MTVENVMYRSVCMGCGCCSNICPTGAIQMEYDNSGYIKPFIDMDKCVECGRCASLCPAVNVSSLQNNDNTPDCYAVQANMDIRLKSSSGGFFTVVAEHIIRNGGVVYGAIWCEDFQCEIAEASKECEIEPMRLSKYVQSKAYTTYEKVVTRLREKTRVVYFGLPCQIAGLRMFMKECGIESDDDLILVDLVCFGAPSNVLFRKYLEEEYGISNVADVKFRDKYTHGWSPFSYSVKLKDGSVIKPNAQVDPYQRAFHGALARNEVCERCQFYNFPRQGDITIGDFWGIQENDPSWLEGNGTSVVLLNNDKARYFFKELELYFDRCEQVPLEWCMNRGNRIGTDARPGHVERKRFEQLLLDGMPFRESVESIMGSKGMIEFSNFRKELKENCTKVVCDTYMIGSNEKLPASQLWISVDNENGGFLDEHICDGYLIAGMAMGMYYSMDVKIHGKVSKKLYYNLIHYVQQILVNHDPGLHKINIFVDGFLSDKDFESGREVIGSPCSFGVDSLSTLYDRWLNEDDVDYKINKVFSFNCGINGAWDDVNTPKLCEDRTRLWKQGFDELGLQIVHVDTNIHQYLNCKMYDYNDAMYLNRYFCILNMQNRLKKYYVASGFSYYDILSHGEMVFRPKERLNKFVSLGWEEPFLLHLLETEHLELILDGAQYQRSEKIGKIAKWSFSYNHLNVCTPGNMTEGDFSKNCSRCTKCFYTMYCLDAIGKLDLYGSVFDLKYYYKTRFSSICKMISNKNEDVLVLDALEYAEKEGNRIVPSNRQARKYYFYKWRFPDIDIYMNPIEELYKKYKGRYILWGTGMVGLRVLAAMDILDLKVSEVVDSDVNKQGKNLFGYTIRDYREIMSDDDVIFVCGMNIFDEVACVVGEKRNCIDVYKLTQL